MPQQVLRLTEEVPLSIPRGQIAEEILLDLSRSGRFEVEWASPVNQHHHRIRSRGWIGHIPISGDLLVQVMPKVPLANVFRMLETAYKLSSFQLFAGSVSIETLEDVFERIAEILARRVLDRARKGLYRCYISHTDDLLYVRGRVNPAGSLQNALKGGHSLSCSFDEYTADLEDNRILLWTLHILPRFNIARAKTRSSISQAHRALSGTVTIQEVVAADCINRFYHRLNDDYRTLHGLCRFFLEQMGPGLKSADREFIPFTLSMPQLFESFVSEWLRSNIPPGLAVYPQYTAKLEANAELTVRIDIMLADVQSGRALAVLDTKYKRQERPLSADIQQIAYYAHEVGARRAFLVYPSKDASPVQVRNRDVLIESIVFDTSLPPETAGAQFLQVLLQRVAS